jgi:ribonuclease H / adenosylcobalamin/alpha-ribazole phosphatase
MIDDQKQPARFFLVRHGETAENLRMTYLGTRDEPLTDNGMQQARKVAAALAQLPIKLIVSSPLRRAADTAIRIREACGGELRLDPRLAESSFGRWEGLTRGEVLKLGSQDSELLARWESDASCSPPGGESIESVQKRILGLVEELAGDHAGNSVVLVSHVGPIKALLAAALDIPLQATRRLFLDPATISIVEWGRHPLLRLFNSHAHLGWTKARWMK